MSDSTFTDEQITAVQGVVDRVNSYQESAPEGTVEANLREGLGEVGVDLGDDQVRSLAEAIEQGGTVDAAQVLG